MADDLYGPGYIYLLGREDGWYRIGRTAHPIQRIRWHNSQGRYHGWGNMTVVYMAKVANQHDAEKALHDAYNSRRTDMRRHGLGPRHEWFRLTQDDIAIFREWLDYLGAEVVNFPDGVI